MRRQRKWNFFCSMIILAAIIVSLAISVVAAEEKIVSEDSLKAFPQGYEYPILPGTDQWLQFHDFPSKIEACQVPEDILKAMSTAQVLESALNYPLNINAFVWNTPEAGYHSVLSYSNVHQELMSRANAAEALIARYGATPTTVAEANEDEQWDRAQQIWLMEIMLQQPPIQQQMNEDQRSVVERCAVEKLEQERGNLFYGEDPTSYYYSVPIQRDLPQHRETYTTITSPHGARIAVLIRGEELSSTLKESMRKK